MQNLLLSKQDENSYVLKVETIEQIPAEDNRLFFKEFLRAVRDLLTASDKKRREGKID